MLFGTVGPRSRSWDLMRMRVRDAAYIGKFMDVDVKLLDPSGYVYTARGASPRAPAEPLASSRIARTATSAALCCTALYHIMPVMHKNLDHATRQSHTVRFMDCLGEEAPDWGL